MSLENVEVETPENFDFLSVIHSHPWAWLEPFDWDEEKRELRRIERLQDGNVVKLFITQKEDKLIVKVDGNSEATDIRARVRWMFRMDDDLSEFYEVCSHNHKLAPAIGKGRILRSSTIFEDIVKTLCTTNLRWRQIVPMVARLVTQLGTPLARDPGYHAFPTPAQIAGVDNEFLRKKIKMGYRADYILEFARNVKDGKFDPDKLRFMGSEDAYKTLKSIKGVGAFSSAYILMLLGHYDYIPIDGYAKSFVSNEYYDGKEVDSKEIYEIFNSYGKWKALAFWFHEGR